MSIQQQTANDVTHAIIGFAMEVHSALGPGLLESAYQACLVDELTRQGFSVVTEKIVNINFKGRVIPTQLRADIVVNNELLIELKAIESLLPLHKAQTLTYMKLLNIPIGLLLNFNTVSLKDGLHRLFLPESNLS